MKKSKRILACLVVAMMVIQVLMPTLARAEGNVIPDPVLKKAINKELKRDEGEDISVEDLQALTKLNVWGH